MHIKHTDEVPQSDVTMEGAAGCRVRWLRGRAATRRPTSPCASSSSNPAATRRSTSTPTSTRSTCSQGEGAIVDGDQERPLRPGDVVFVAPDDVHQFRNTGSTPLQDALPDPQLGHRQDGDRRPRMRPRTARP